jgi:hypothetical protein
MSNSVYNSIKTTNLESIQNTNILIVGRLKETKNIRCGNLNDTLVNNNCYHNDEDPYTAQCPIKYNMYQVNNAYKCYKDCPENTTSGEITSVNYTINRKGKQCIKKTFVNK